LQVEFSKKNDLHNDKKKLTLLIIFTKRKVYKVQSLTFNKRAAPLIITLSCLLVMFLSASIAQAAVLRWTGATSNDWNDNTNWIDEATNAAPAAVPSARDDVIIPVTVNEPAISATSAICGSLEVRLRAVLHINGSDDLTVTNNSGRSGDVNNAGIINIAATSSPGAAPDGSEFLLCTGTLLNTGVINIGVVEAGTTSLTAGALNNVGPTGAPVTGTGTINITDRLTQINVYRDWISSGTFNTIAGATVNLLQSGILEHTSINGFANLHIEGSIRTLASDLVVTGDLEVGVGAGPATLDTMGYNVDVGGTTTIGDDNTKG